MKQQIWVYPLHQGYKNNFLHTDYTCHIKGQKWVCSYHQCQSRTALTYGQFGTFRLLCVDSSNSPRGPRGPWPALLKSMCLCLSSSFFLMGNTTSNAIFIYLSKAILLTDKIKHWLRSTNGTLNGEESFAQAEEWTAVLPVCWSKVLLNLQCSRVCVRERKPKRFKGGPTASWGTLTPLQFYTIIKFVTNVRHINTKPSASIKYRLGSKSICFKWSELWLGFVTKNNAFSARKFFNEKENVVNLI